MMQEFGYKNAMQVPRLEKITVNVGVGEATQNAKAIDTAVAEITAITGQKPVVTRAKKAIANFKLREGVPIGCMVTLRRERMYEFFDRLIHVALPRVRDFKGISDRSFDGRGNYSLGLREQIIFPEIHADKVEKTRGMTITITTTAKTDPGRQSVAQIYGDAVRELDQGGIPLAKTCLRIKAETTEQIQSARIQSVPAVRPGAGVLPALPYVPALFARSRAQGTYPGTDKGQLVSSGETSWE